MFQLRAVFRQHRHTAEVEHIQNIGKGKLVLQGERDDIKFIKRIAAFQTVKRDVRLPHFLLHVDPRRADALAPDSFLVVETWRLHRCPENRKRT